MLIQIDQLRNTVLDQIFEEIRSIDCRIRCRDLMVSLGYNNYDRFDSAIESAKKTCYSLNIPVRYHFKTVFIDDGSAVHQEYLLSPYACYLTTMNADDSLPAVARIQLYLLKRK